MFELDEVDLAAHADRLRLLPRAADPAHAMRGADDARGALSAQGWPQGAYHALVVAEDIAPLARAAVGVKRAAAQEVRTTAPRLLDLQSQLRFDEHPAYTFAYLLAAAAWCRGEPCDAPTLDPAWLRSLEPAVQLANNPAKQMARRFFTRTPLLWTETSGSAGIAHDWRLRILRYAESAAIVADTPDMVGAWSMARFPNFWPNSVSIARLPAAQTAATQTAATQTAATQTAATQTAATQTTATQTTATQTAATQTAATQTAAMQGLLRKRRFDTFDVDAPGRDTVETALHLLHLGEWVALYLAALYGVDPADRVPLQILGEVEAGQPPRSAFIEIWSANRV